MKLVQIDEQEIKGLSIRTTNKNEMNPENARIGKLWQTFDEKVVVDYQNGKRVYGIYYNYESDANGEFSVLAGTDQDDASTNELEKIKILSGQYIVFEAKGDIPQVVIETWGKIWEYFSNENTEHQRAYTTDFEYYKNQNEIEIYIAVK